MPWTRDTPWRQGAILSSEHFPQLGLDAPDGNLLAVAISHDCDITNDNLATEPFVEFVIAKAIEKHDGNNTHAKNPRTLHLQVTHKGSDVVLELYAPNKVSIEKGMLHTVEPGADWAINREGQRILQHWLAARYKRQSLPDALVERLRPVSDFLQKQGKKHSKELLGYWLDYEPFGIELAPDEPYELWLYAVYTTDEPDAQANAQQISESLGKNFADLIKKNGDVGHIDLRACEAYSEEEFTLRDLRGNIEYRLDFISLRPKSAGPVID